MNRSVLVLRALGLGDALTGVPALRGLRRSWPDARIVLAAQPAIGGWLGRLRLVDDVLPSSGVAPLEFGPGHVAVNLHGRGPQSHGVLQATQPSRLVAFACAEAGHVGGPAWQQDEHDAERWCRLVTSVGGSCGLEDLRLPHPGERDGHIVIHPGAAFASRRWPAGRWAAVAEALGRRGAEVVVTGSAAERELCAQVAASGGRDLCGALDVDGLAEVVARARLVICGDTGVGHLATAYATPSVVLFGPVPPAWWGPAIDPDLHVVMWRGNPSDPWVGDPHGHTIDPMLARIEVDEVVTTTESLLARAGSGQPP